MLESHLKLSGTRTGTAEDLLNGIISDQGAYMTRSLLWLTTLDEAADLDPGVQLVPVVDLHGYPWGLSAGQQRWWRHLLLLQGAEVNELNLLQQQLPSGSPLA
jgi:hypothetical protein